MQNDFSKSVRLPKHWNDQLSQFAKKYRVSASYVYRSAIQDFINAKCQSL